MIGNNGWSEQKTGKDFLTTDELIDKWVKQFITDIGKRKKYQLKACKRHNLAAGATQGKIAYTQTLEKLILKSSK